MSGDKPQATFMKQLAEEIENAKEAVRESEGLDHSSYGAGYDQGYLDALKKSMILAMEDKPIMIFTGEHGDD